jgi:hypothetical protein
MQTKNGLFQISKKHIGLIIVLAGVLLVSAACGGTVVNSPTATPTTTLGDMPTNQPAPVESTQAASSALPVSTGADFDVCSLATSSEVATVLGSTPITSIPGSELDDVSGATLYFCTYLGNGLAVIISTVDTGSSQAATTFMQTQLEKMQANDPSIVVNQETGLGDQVYWAVAEKAVSYNVLKGNRVFSVSLGGAIGDPNSHKAALLTLTESVAATQ